MSILREERRMLGRWILKAGRRFRDALCGKVVLPNPNQLPERILIIRPYFLGDILLCLPVAQAIKQQNPKARISWLLHGEWQDLLRNHSVVDEVIPFSKTKMHSVSALGEFFRVVGELRKRQFDLVINLAWDRSSLLWSWLSGAPVRLGIEEYGRPRLLSLLYTTTVIAPERSKDEAHMSDFYYEPLKLLGFESRKDLPNVFPTEEEEQRVEAKIGKQPFILIHPGARLADRQWDKERFKELIQKLGSQMKHSIVLACGPGEKSWVADMASVLPEGRSFFWPEPNLGEFMALAKRALLFVGNVSGPMHLAAASGCRLVVIFGKHPHRWKPLGNNHEIIENENGIKMISVEKVLNVVLKAVAE